MRFQEFGLRGAALETSGSLGSKGFCCLGFKRVIDGSRYYFRVSGRKTLKPESSELPQLLAEATLCCKS